jgi:hypothetical protein
MQQTNWKIKQKEKFNLFHKGYNCSDLIKSDFFKIIASNDEYLLGKMFEDTFFINKGNNELVFEWSFYGSCDCGLISSKNNWCIAAGECLVFWKNDALFLIDDDDIRWICDVREIDSWKIEFLIDPWANNSAIYELNISTLEYKKLRDFNDHKEKEYVENVQW